MALGFRAEAFAATDFEAAVPDLAAVLEAADAAFFDAAEAALVDATDVARARVVADLPAAARRDVATRPAAARAAGRVACAFAFAALFLTDEVFTELCLTEALAIVFALLAGALDATAFEVVALAAFDVLVVEFALAALLLGGMVGTLPG